MNLGKLEPKFIEKAPTLPRFDGWWYHSEGNFPRFDPNFPQNEEMYLQRDAIFPQKDPVTVLFEEISLNSKELAYINISK